MILFYQHNTQSNGSDFHHDCHDFTKVEDDESKIPNEEWDSKLLSGPDAPGHKEYMEPIWHIVYKIQEKQQVFKQDICLSPKTDCGKILFGENGEPISIGWWDEKQWQNLKHKGHDRYCVNLETGPKIHWILGENYIKENVNYLLIISYITSE